MSQGFQGGPNLTPVAVCLNVWREAKPERGSHSEDGWAVAVGLWGWTAPGFALPTRSAPESQAPVLHNAGSRKAKGSLL